MAEHAIDKAALAGGLNFAACKTKNLKIHGWVNNKRETLLEIYGADAIEIKNMMEADSTLAEKIHPLFDYTKAEVKWVIENEMAITVEDILARRIRLLFLDAKAAMEAAPVVAQMLTLLTGKDEEWENEQIKTFNKLVLHYLVKH